MIYQLATTCGAGWPQHPFNPFCPPFIQPVVVECRLTYLTRLVCVHVRACVWYCNSPLIEKRVYACSPSTVATHSKVWNRPLLMFTRLSTPVFPNKGLNNVKVMTSCSSWVAFTCWEHLKAEGYKLMTRGCSHSSAIFVRALCNLFRLSEQIIYIFCLSCESTCTALNVQNKSGCSFHATSTSMVSVSLTKWVFCIVPQHS